MATQPIPPAPAPAEAPQDFLIVDNPDVNIEGVHVRLLTFAAVLGKAHKALFGEPLVITSGTDGLHVAGSLHKQGRAVDLRVRDLEPIDQLVFYVAILRFAPQWECRVFDERAGEGGQHVHIEYHGA